MNTKTAKTTKKVTRTSPAIELLERGIKLLHDKEYKNARSCFQEVIEKYAEEKDVVVRAVSYAKSCESFIVSHKPGSRTAEEFYNLGVIKHNQEDYDEAIKLFNEAQKLDPKSDYIYYALAASHALKNDLADAVKNLDRAVKMNKDNIVFAKNDADFDTVRKEKEFADLLGLSAES